MASETLYPDAIITQTGLSGAVSTINSAEDGTWLTTNASNSVLRVSFGTPGTQPTTGAGLQVFRLYVRKNASGGGDPTIDSVELYESGTLRQTLAGTPITVTSATGVAYTFTWTASNLTVASGANVEVRVTSSKGGGGPNERNVEFDSVSWVEDFAVSVTYDGTGTDSALASESGQADLGPATYDGTGTDSALASQSGAAEIPATDFTTDLAAWYDASDATTITESASLLSQWDDKSGNTRHLTAAGAAQPEYSLNEQFTKPGIRFATDDVMDAPAFASPLAQPNTIMVVMRLDSIAGATDQAIVNAINATGRHGITFDSGTDSHKLYSGVTYDSGTASTATRLLTGLFNGTSSELWEEGVSTGTGDAGTEDYVGVRLGQSETGAIPLSGVIFEVRVYNRELTTGERELAESALTTKWLTEPATNDGTGTSVATASESGIATGGVAAKSLLYVRAAAGATAGDTTFIGYFEADDWSVTQYSAGDAIPGDLSPYDAVYISESSLSADVTTKWLNAAIGIVMAENAAWVDMEMASGNNILSATTTLTVVGSHPIVTGYSGDTAILSSAAQMRYGITLPGSAVVLAHEVGTAANEVMWANESGDTLLNSFVAPARRVGMGLHGDTMTVLNSAGQDILLAAANWVAGIDPAGVVSATGSDSAVASEFGVATGGTLSPKEILLVKGNAFALNASENAVISRLESQGHTVTVEDDDTLTTVQADGYDLVIMSKTVGSLVIGTTLYDSTAPVMFWEDNQQMLGMMATIDNDGSGGTTWHSTGNSVYVDAAATPSELRAGLSGETTIYTSSAEITWAPSSGTSELASGASPIARLGGGGTSENRYSIYVYDSGSTLADATAANGKRGYFGLYDDTFTLLNADGLALFDAQVTWLLGSAPIFSGTGTSTATASESASAASAASTAASDSALASESSVAGRTLPAQGSSFATASESGPSENVLGATGSDAADASESGAGIHDVVVSASDAADASESSQAAKTRNAVGDSFATASESSQARNTLGATGDDFALASESSLARKTRIAVGSDFATASESDGALANKEATGSDFAIASENSNPVIVGATFVYDGTGTSVATASESSAVLIDAAPQSSDTALASESSAPEADRNAAGSDSALASESPDHQVVAQPLSTDAALASESALGVSTLPVSGSDAAVASEGSAASVALEGTGAEASGASESTTASIDAAAAASDAADASENAIATVVGASVTYDGTGTSIATASEQVAANTISSPQASDTGLASESSAPEADRTSSASSAATTNESGAVEAGRVSSGATTSTASESGLGEASFAATAADLADASETGDATVDSAVVVDATGLDVSATAESATIPEVSAAGDASDFGLASESGSTSTTADGVATESADASESSAVSTAFNSAGIDAARASEFGYAFNASIALVPAAFGRTAVVDAISVSYALASARSVQPRASPRSQETTRGDRTVVAPRREE